MEPSGLNQHSKSIKTLNPRVGEDTVNEDGVNEEKGATVNTYDNFTVTYREEAGKKLCVVAFHTQNKPVNILTFEFMQEFSELLDKPEVINSDYVVFTSAKPGVFMAGADITLIEKITDLADGREKAQAGKEIFSKFRNIRGKTVAWINGVCLGGGCELSLFCDLLVMDLNPKTKIGLPETQLGILPGWGGTVLLPRRIGAKEALGMILKGSTVDAKKAARLRLADAVVAQGARPTVEACQAVEYRKKKNRRNILVQGILSALTPLIVMMARKQIEAQAKTYPALPLVCDVVRKTYFLPEKKAYEIESEAFAKLAISPTSKNLIRIFYLSEEAKKTGAQKVKPIEHLGVLGGGVMGVGIALAAAKSNIMTRVKDLNMDILKNSVISNQKASRKVWHRWVPALQKHLHVQTDEFGFNSMECVVEAVFEDLNLKKKIFADLENSVSDTCILTTNTSSLPLSDIESTLRNKSRFAGLHFFNPVLRMPLVEVIRAAQTSDETIHRLCNLVTRMGKVPLVCKDTSGFVVNRILGFYLNEGIHLLADGVEPERMESAAKKFGMPMGPLRLLDEVGIDVAIHVSRILDEKHGGRYAPRGGLDVMANEKRLGKKSKKGFYIYGDKKKEELDIAWCKSLCANIPDCTDMSVSDEDIIDRLILPMVAEGCRIIHEGIVDSPGWVDVGMIFGTGFPPYRGGLLRYAQDIGVTHVMDRLQQFERSYTHAARFGLGPEKKVLLTGL